VNRQTAGTAGEKKKNDQKTKKKKQKKQKSVSVPEAATCASETRGKIFEWGRVGGMVMFKVSCDPSSPLGDPSLHEKAPGARCRTFKARPQICRADKGNPHAVYPTEEEGPEEIGSEQRGSKYEKNERRTHSEIMLKDTEKKNTKFSQRITR